MKGCSDNNWIILDLENVIYTKNVRCTNETPKGTWIWLMLQYYTQKPQFTGNKDVLVDRWRKDSKTIFSQVFRKFLVKWRPSFYKKHYFYLYTISNLRKLFICDTPGTKDPVFPVQRRTVDWNQEWENTKMKVQKRSFSFKVLYILRFRF